MFRVSLNPVCVAQPAFRHLSREFLSAPDARESVLPMVTRQSMESRTDESPPSTVVIGGRRRKSRGIAFVE